MQRAFLRLYVKLRVLESAVALDESGQDLVEFALVATLIALAATAGMPALATAISNAFTHISAKVGTYTS